MPDIDYQKLLQDLSRDNLYAFIPWANPQYKSPFHLRPYVDALISAIAHREQINICVSAPPRHGKSETTVFACAWALWRDPTIKIAYVCYDQKLAMYFSRKVRRLAHLLGVRLRHDSKAAGLWETEQGGLFVASGIIGGITGFGFDVMLVDDPLKNRAAAESAVQREAVWQELGPTIYSRIEKGGSCVVIGTRWHLDDPIARLTTGEYPWPFINLPAIGDDGAALWPDRWPLEELEKKRRANSEYDWASLYMGQPRPRGSALFKDPVRYERADLNGKRIVIACDPAVSEKTTADYSAVVVLAMHGAHPLYQAEVIDAWRGQVETIRLCGVLEAFQTKYNVPIVIEACGTSKTVPQILRAIKPGLKFVEVPAAEMTKDKFTRAQPVAAAWCDGRVRVPMQAPWLRDFLQEVTSFTGTGDRHDDQVDALAHAWNAIALRQPGVRRGVGESSGPFG